MERGDYTFKIDDFAFVDGLFSALVLLKNKGFEFIIITNQGGISKKIYTHHDVSMLNNLINTKFHYSIFFIALTTAMWRNVFAENQIRYF